MPQTTKYWRFLILVALVFGLTNMSIAAAEDNGSHAGHQGHKHAHAKVARHAKHAGVSIAHHSHHKHHGKAALTAQGHAAKEAAAAQARRRAEPNTVVDNEASADKLRLESNAAMIMNADTGELLYGKNTDRSMPIASITKLMTAMVVLDAKLPLDEKVTVTETDVDALRHTGSRLPVGTTTTRGELMLLALMASENRAAAALARTYPGGTAAAVKAMNDKAATLGMSHSHFLDPTGLHAENTSTPNDLVLMVKAAHEYAEIRRFSTTAEHELVPENGRRIVQFHNTNPLVKNSDWDIGVTKTGFINESGKCLVMHAKIAAMPIIIVLMDSWGKYTRVGDANRVKKWLESAIQMHGLKLSRNN